QNTLVVPYNNTKAVEQIFRLYPKEIAAVIVEPVAANMGVVPPQPGLLDSLRKVTREFGALLIFDEVITGFRFHYGAIAQQLNITPDLICLGKIIGGGLPIGAYGGSEKIMRFLAPAGPVYQASTFAGNPLVMRAGASALSVLRKNAAGYARINAFTMQLVTGLTHAARAQGVDLGLRHYGSMFSLRFKNPGQFKVFYNHMRQAGVFLAPSEFEANFVSFAHTHADITYTIYAAQEAFKKL
ncbi:MAG: aminotransferase class III-fold pyridoxal phosphate-dependent enzyme, partial [Candidatus Omnitrophica bacterium]|nr:aminotransferase class III-fold pyridoxal phosphate-dependent enzyme [Candidatus Omnitrophota bacterium]